MPPPDVSSRTRGVPRALWIVAVALFLARIGSGVQERRHPPELAELVQWQPVEQAAARARTSGRPVLYEFSAEWCGPCQRMKREVFADRQSAQTINTLFVPVQLVDTQRETGSNPPDVAMLQARYKVNAFPTLVVAPVDGSEPTIIEGYPGKSGLMQQLTTAGVKARLQRGGIR